MLRSHSSRRRSNYTPQICAAASALLLLLLSLFVLHTRLSSPLGLRLNPQQHHPNTTPLLDDADNDAFDSASDDRIDVLDVDDERNKSTEILDDDDPDSDESDLSRNPSSGYFWDHLLGVTRRSFGKPSDPWAESDGLQLHDRSKIAFGSDDQPVDEDIRLKLDSIRAIEDVLLIKIGNGGDSPLREGWVRWLEGKGDFLRRDQMFRSNLELLNPKNHPLLQDPDGPGLTSLTKGDRLMQKAIWKEMEKTPFGGNGEINKRVEGRRTLDLEATEKKNSPVELKDQERYADGRRWGYFPGLDPHLSFSEFMDRFLEQCSLRVFMVWNSPPWTYSVRHQRGLESLLHHHRDACVVVFSETMELDFFKDFVKDGFRIAVAMPNLDELLKDTPDYIFASAWFEWRKIEHYPVHYSELIRLAALFKYGGVYLDSDVIVLKPLHSHENSIGMEDEMAGSAIFNGAVMAFKRHSSFIMECLGEFYSTYDDSRLRWNGADLMTRVVNRLLSAGDKSYGQLDIKIESPHAFFPISSQNITRYFVAASDEIERTQQDYLFTRILNESTTFHFWNGLTSTLVPEPNSLVERLLNQYCLHCLDVL